MLSRLKGAFYQFLKLQYQSEAGRRRLGRGLRTHPGRVAAYEIVRRARSHAVRRVCVEVIQTLAETPAARAEFCALAERHHRRAPNDPVRFDIYAVALAHSDDTNKAVEVLFCEAAENFLAKNPDESNIAGARVGVGHEKEDYRFVAEASREATFQAPDALQLRLDYLKAAYAAGKLLRTDDATEFVARQYSIISSHPGPATSRELGVTIDHILATCAEALHSRIQLLRMRLNREPKVAVFFLSSTHALGHAILDPYHFLALHREKFDRIIFMGPGRESY
ncbi:MAG: hypothetical protein K0U93_27315, partial [Gammaproteobacteria bacterium]|nr:hypothetical protein [Gammaproteobacteria bacterium]